MYRCIIHLKELSCCAMQSKLSIRLMLSSTVSVFFEDKDCSVDNKNLLLVLLRWSKLEVPPS